MKSKKKVSRHWSTGKIESISYYDLNDFGIRHRIDGPAYIFIEYNTGLIKHYYAIRNKDFFPWWKSYIYDPHLFYVSDISYFEVLNENDKNNK